MRSIPLSEEDGADVLLDEISLVVVDGTQGNKFSGQGELRDDGLRTRLDLLTFGPNYEGTWEDTDEAGNVQRSGTVRMTPLPGGDFAGLWELDATDREGQSGKSKGTWMLRKALGVTAVH